MEPWSLAAVALVLWSCHFSRRIVECLWVHRYADRRVPLSDAIGEYLYYWGFGAWIAHSMASRTSLDLVVALGLVLFFLGETGNGWAHLKLRALRRPNTKERGIPKGGLFNWVSCANYSYEIVTWTGFCIATRTLAAGLYWVGVVAVLMSWAKKRHARYHDYFDGSEGRPLYPKQRQALIPGIF
jgi:very-long-chain enoyl-CoA reductase